MRQIITTLCFLLTCVAINAQDGLTFTYKESSKTAAVNAYNGTVTDVVIPATVTYNNEEYTVTAISGSAFYKNTSLTSVSMPKTITSIDNYAFGYCSSLKEIKVADENGMYYSQDGVLFKKGDGGNSLVAYPSAKAEKEYIVPEGVVETLEGAFAYTEVEKVTFNEGFTTLGKYTFSYCTALKEVTLSSSVTSIGYLAFDGCTNLQKLTSNAVTPPTLNSDYEFSGSSSLVLYVPTEVYSSYSNWSEYVKTIHTIDNTYYISANKEWENAVANNMFTDQDAKIYLTADIIATIGDVSLCGNATFNGNGHSITITGPLFNEVAKEATVKNLIVNPYETKEEEPLSDFNYGLLARTNNGTIESCAVEIGEEVIHYGLVESNEGINVTVGLLVGENSGAIQNCYAMVNGPFTDEYVNILDGEIITTFGALVGKMTGGELKDAYVYVTSRGSLPEGKATVGSLEGEAPVCANIFYCYTNGIEVSDDDGVGSEKVDSEVCITSNFIARFSNPAKWELIEIVADVWPGTPKLSFKDVDAKSVYDVETKSYVVDVELSDTTDVSEFVDVLTNNPDVFAQSIVKLACDIDYNSETDTVVPTLNRVGTTSHPFNGTFDGGGYAIKNMTVNSDAEGSGAFFGVLNDSAVVKNMAFENVMVTVNSIKNDYIEDDTIYVGVFADELKGKLQNVSFVGNVEIDEAIAKDKVVKLCFASVGDDSANDENADKDNYSIDHAFIYLTDTDKPTDETTEGNKVCIVIKQHIGAGRKSGRTRKTCSNRRNKKALVIKPSIDEEDQAGSAAVSSEYREFSDEEFARGDVAYWLNYAQKGYTGEYIGEWTQGEFYPVWQESATNPLVKIVYTIEGNDDIEFASASFANVGSSVTMSYDEMPDEVEIDGELFTSAVGALSTTFLVPMPDLSEEKPAVAVKLIYNKVATGITSTDVAEPQVTAKGMEVSVRGACGERVRIMTLRGVEMLNDEVSTDNLRVLLPQAGVYVVEVGNTTKKVVCR